jgi:enolase
MDIKIKEVKARQILDSRGNPTVEVDIFSDDVWARAAVPSGASTGAFEAHELRDNDKTCFGGKGVTEACSNVYELFNKFKSRNFKNYVEFDQALIEADGTSNKSTFGANAILGLSLAFAKLEAETKGLPFYKLFSGDKKIKMPIPLMNVLNGGAHSNNGLDIQEFMIVPRLGEQFFDSVRAGAEVFQQLKTILSKKGLSVAVGDEGGFAPELNGNLEALDLLMEAIEKAGYKPGVEIFLALDVASTEFYKEEEKVYSFEGGQLTSDDLLDVYQNMVKSYPIFSIEDAFAEEDWAAWSKATEVMGANTQLVGDDLFVTNVSRIKRGLEEKSANALLVKPNQIGTVSETVSAVNLMHESGCKTVMSHRSGETEDVSIAHLAIGLGCHQIKTGSLCRGERTAKYNELIRLEESCEDAIWLP